jgi:carboxyl-terminal processing protease
MNDRIGWMSLCRTFVVVVLLLGAYHLGRSDVSPDSGPDFDQAQLNEVWGAILGEYLWIDDVKPEKVSDGIVKGLVKSLGDEFSSFLDSDEAEQFSSGLESSLEGIGAELRMSNGIVTIVAPLKNSPAIKAGILPGDLIFKVDGVRIKETDTLWSVVQRIRGEKGTEVVLNVFHEGGSEAVDVSIVRERIELVTVEWEEQEHEGVVYAYVEIGSFTENVSKELEIAIEEIKSSGLDKMVLDLRFNGGGFLDEAVNVLSLLVGPDKVAVVTRNQDSSSEKKTHLSDVRWSDELVVLVNDISASASEIVAGAIQDHGRGKIVGETSFGKGTVQVVRQISGGGMLKLTIAEWLTPNGREINEKGIEPDLEIKMSYDLWQTIDDPQLNEAVLLFR